MYGVFVWARRALKHQKHRFPARAGGEVDDCDAATGEIGAGGETESGGGASGVGAIRGCTDYHARNYQLNATSDDGSCLFAHYLGLVAHYMI